jgi:hypothetical protein
MVVPSRHLRALRAHFVLGEPLRLRAPVLFAGVWRNR